MDMSPSLETGRDCKWKRGPKSAPVPCTTICEMRTSGLVLLFKFENAFDREEKECACWGFKSSMSNEQ